MPRNKPEKNTRSTTNPLPKIPVPDTDLYEVNKLDMDAWTHMPYIDIYRLLDDESKDLMEEAESIARSFNSKSILPIHVLYACLENGEINNKMRKNGINPEVLITALNETTPEGTLIEGTSQGSDLPISGEVEEILRDALGEDPVGPEPQVRPYDIFVTVLQKDYDGIREVLKQVGVDGTRLVDIFS